MSYCYFFKNLDFYGKPPELYFKGKPKKTSLIGTIFSYIFITIYIIIFIYKLYRMFKRIDITFYDIYSLTEEIPSIDVTNENFYLTFSIYNALNEPFINNSIYYPVAYFNDKGKKEMQVEPCDINKIGTKYKQLFKESNLKNYYCLNKVNHTLRALENSFYIQLFPCKNSTENNYSCQPREIIEESLNNKKLEILLEDIILTPFDFKNSVQPKENFLYRF